MRGLEKYALENALIYDIETVRCEKSLPKTGDLRDSWENKVNRDGAEGVDIDEEFLNKAALYGEFNKIVCITVGRFKGGELVTKSYAGDDEKEILTNFFSDLDRFPVETTYLCGKNILRFDNPVVMKRAIVNGVKLNRFFDTSHLPPWEKKHIVDIEDLWRGGGFYNASLMSMSVALGIPHPKSDIDGSEVSDLYYSKKKDKMERIVRYCMEDVRVTAEIFKRLKEA